MPMTDAELTFMKLILSNAIMLKGQSVDIYTVLNSILVQGIDELSLYSTHAILIPYYGASVKFDS